MHNTLYWLSRSKKTFCKSINSWIHTVAHRVKTLSELYSELLIQIYLHTKWCFGNTDSISGHQSLGPPRWPSWWPLPRSSLHWRPLPSMSLRSLAFTFSFSFSLPFVTIPHLPVSVTVPVSVLSPLSHWVATLCLSSTGCLAHLGSSWWGLKQTLSCMMKRDVVLQNESGMLKWSFQAEATEDDSVYCQCQSSL